MAYNIEAVKISCENAHKQELCRFFSLLNLVPCYWRSSITGIRITDSYVEQSTTVKFEEGPFVTLLTNNFDGFVTHTIKIDDLEENVEFKSELMYLFSKFYDKMVLNETL